MMPNQKIRDFILKNIRIETEEENSYKIQISSEIVVQGPLVESEIKNNRITCLACKEAILCNGEIEEIISHIEDRHPEIAL